MDEERGTGRDGYEVELAELADRYDLADVYVFGSRAAEFKPTTDLDHAEPERPTPDADLDIGVRSRKGRHLTARERAELTVALEDLFDVPRVDIVIVPEASPYLALAVISGELYDICSSQLGDLEKVRDGIMRWIDDNPDRIDRAL